MYIIGLYRVFSSSWEIRSLPYVFTFILFEIVLWASRFESASTVDTTITLSYLITGSVALCRG
ncbi:hypothetical protein BRC82_06250 [Halobacteriales archaeon QS_1_67_19]|nr:MAG: hypothetical protein BRC82_06250 [Halobacteriales archaeon QS_1_67_19]